MTTSAATITVETRASIVSARRRSARRSAGERMITWPSPASSRRASQLLSRAHGPRR